MMNFRTILLFGAPGAGKGTQGKLLGTIPNYFHCACGDVFRSLKADSEIGRGFLEYFSPGTPRSGRFHPEQDTLVLDGIPRNVRQAKILKGTLDVIAIFNLGSPHR